jgi:hypothetical protein
MNTVTCLLKARIVKPAETTIARLQQSKQTPIAQQWLSKCHMTAATVTYTIEELLEVVFSVWSVPGLYNEEQLPLRDLSRQLGVQFKSLKGVRNSLC